jgi:serine protease Do
MHRLARAIALLAVLAQPARGRGEPGREAVALQETFQRVIERAEPSIACVLVSRSDDYARYGEAPPDAAAGKLGRFDPRPHLLHIPFDRREQAAAIKALDLARPETVPEAFGSGVVLDESGLVLTNAHVVRRATKVYVRLPGNRGSYADVHAADPRSDLAVLRLLDPPPGLRAIKFGDADRLKKGQWVVSLSNPYAAGFRDGGPSASVGVVSNLRRRGPADPNEYEAGRQPLHAFGTLIQTDVRVNLGCSGGAILDLNGELVGLTTALAALSGSDAPGGFALPMDAAYRRIIEVLRRGEEVEYGFLGISMSRDAPPGTPVLIGDAITGGPAKAAGIAKGDYVVAIDGRPVRDHDDLLLLIGVGLAGHDVKVEVASGSPDGPRRAVTVRLAKSPVSGPVIASQRPPAQAGLRVDHASVVARQNDDIPRGVAIREVVPDSPADRARLQAGKVITAVDGRRVTTPEEFRRAMKKAGKKVELTVLELGGKREETITLEND